MSRLYALLRSPGDKGPIEDAAPTQLVPVGHQNMQEEKMSGVEEVLEEPGPVQNLTGYTPKAKDRKLDRALDWVVAASGSEPVFLFILACLLLWVFLGIPYGKMDVWAIVISNAQAIFSYMFDSLLMRQQLNSYENLVQVSASLRSRAISHRRMLRQLQASAHPMYSALSASTLAGAVTTVELPRQKWVDRVTTYASEIAGHFVTICLYWVCIAVWIGFGQYCDWSVRWQLYINSSTSALMVLIFAFLANVRERHNIYMERCLQDLFHVDSTVEFKLRKMTGDAVPNPTVVIPAPKMGRAQRAIFYYADLVGTLSGIAILIVVLVVWVVVGPVMKFDGNWWLLIGTYAGLVGLNDGFVLRNVQMRLDSYQDSAFDEVDLEDKSLLADIGMPDPGQTHCQARSLSYRLSARMGTICSHEITVGLGVALIVGLLAGASVMRWTETGQLLCNIPPSIVESFFMLILITGHNICESKRRADISNLYLRRLRLLAYVEELELLHY